MAKLAHYDRRLDVALEFLKKARLVEKTTQEKCTLRLEQAKVLMQLARFRLAEEQLFFVKKHSIDLEEGSANSVPASQSLRKQQVLQLIDSWTRWVECRLELQRFEPRDLGSVEKLLAAVEAKYGGEPDILVKLGDCFVRLNDFSGRFQIVRDFDNRFLVKGKALIRKAFALGDVSPDVIDGGLGACLVKIAWVDGVRDLNLVEKVLAEIETDLEGIRGRESTRLQVQTSIAWIRAKSLKRKGHYKRALKQLELGMNYAFNSSYQSNEFRDLGFEITLLAFKIKNKIRTPGHWYSPSTEEYLSRRSLLNMLRWLPENEFRPAPDRYRLLCNEIANYLTVYPELGYLPWV